MLAHCRQSNYVSESVDLGDLWKLNSDSLGECVRWGLSEWNGSDGKWDCVSVFESVLHGPCEMCTAQHSTAPAQHQMARGLPPLTPHPTHNPSITLWPSELQSESALHSRLKDLLQHSNTLPLSLSSSLALDKLGRPMCRTVKGNTTHNLEKSHTQKCTGIFKTRLYYSPGISITNLLYPSGMKWVKWMDSWLLPSSTTCMKNIHLQPF